MLPAEYMESWENPTRSAPSDAEFLYRISVQLDPEPWLGRSVQEAVGVWMKRLRDELIQVRRRRKIFHIACDRQSRRQMQICRQADRRVPAVGDQQNVVFLGQPADAQGFGQAAALGAIGLDDVHGVILEERTEIGRAHV